MSNLSQLIRDKKLCNFAKLLDNHHYKYNIGEVFKDFLQLSVCAYSFGRLEKTYHQTIKRYEKKELEMFPQMLGEIMIYFKSVERWADPFGEIYETIAGNMKRSNFGQFFTPEAVCDMCSGSLLYGTDESKEKLNILDPASGSGRMLLSFHSLSRKPNFYTAVDVDSTCVFMTALNMLHHGMQGIVVHGNSLSVECWGAYEINPFINTGIPSIRPLTAEAGRKILESPFIKQAQEKPKEAEQTSLFVDVF
jgi:type I restriction enzyme M protein